MQVQKFLIHGSDLCCVKTAKIIVVDVIWRITKCDYDEIKSPLVLAGAIKTFSGIERSNPCWSFPQRSQHSMWPLKNNNEVDSE